MTERPPFDFEAAVSELRAATERADSAAVEAVLARLAGKRPPRPLTRTLLHLARRAGRYDLALRWLNPIVRPTSRKPVEATGEEKSEYAASLIRSGAVEEGLELLRTVDGNAVPQALLYEALGLFTRWDYGPAIPVLERYLGCAGLSPYQLTVGKLNLLAAKIAEGRLDDFESLYAPIERELRATTERKLYANLLEMRAQWAIIVKRWDEAETALGKAREILVNTGLLDEILLEKWTTILVLFRDGASPERLGRLHAVRAAAQGAGHWETLRDCDRVEARLTGDKKLLHRVLVGTPYPRFRERTLQEFPGKEAPPERYELDLGEGSPESALDLLSGHRDGRPCGVKPGKQIHRLLVCLTADLYRPLGLGALHFQLFPNEYFNPHSAPLRVHAALSRFRQWASRARVPLEVRVESGHYSLRARRPFRLILYRSPEGSAAADARLRLLADRFGDREFRRRDAQRALKLSDSSVTRLLSSSVESGELEALGRGKATRYRLKRAG